MSEFIDDEEDYYEDEYDIDEDYDSEPLILQFDEDGKLGIKKPEDYVEMKKEDFELMNGFIDKHKKLFDEYVKNYKK